MHQKVLLCSSIVLLLFVLSFTYGKPAETEASEKTVGSNQASKIKTSGKTVGSNQASKIKTSGKTVGSSKSSFSSKDIPTTYDTYGYNYTYNYTDNYGDYYGYNYTDNYGYNGDDDGYPTYNYDTTGYDGIDPRPYGQDIGDFGPVYDDQKPMLGLLDVWISSADDWEQNSKPNYRGSSPGYNSGYKKPNKKNSYKGQDYSNGGDYKKKGSRQKRSYSRVRFPVKQISDIRRFPLRRVPPLISILPWLPIFYDRITYQTYIFSPTGGIYIIPPLINFYGKRFAVAQLIKWGYASLVSSGAPPPPNVNVAPLVQPPPPAGGPVTAGVVGSSDVRPAPNYDAKTARFSDGVKTDFPTFKPRYSQTLEEGGNRNYGPSYGKTDYSDTNYGGTGKQQIYAQGGARSGSASSY